VSDFHEGRMDARILKEFEATRSTGGMVLLAYDPAAGRLDLVDPKTGGPALLEEKPRKEATRLKVPAKKKAAKRRK